MERVIYLKKLTQSIRVEYDEDISMFCVTNDTNDSIVLTAPMLKWSPMKGVHLVDNDPTEQFTADVLFTATSYGRLNKGSIP